MLRPEMIIDPSKLSDVDIAAFTKCLSEKRKDLTARINTTAKEYLLREEVPGFVPAFASDPEFMAMWFSRWYIALRGRVCNDSSKGSLISVIFPVTVYMYECYGLTPSKLLLGCETKTRLPQWLQRWMAQVAHLDPEGINNLYRILDGGQYVRQDAVYTLKQRISEMADERRVPLDDFMVYPGAIIRDVPDLLAFASTTLTEINDYSTMKPFLGSHRLLRMVIALCVVYKVSPEYLLLQDYSNFITTEDGGNYPLIMQRLLSIMLRVDAGTREKAKGYVQAAMAMQAASGASIPMDVAHRNDNSATINITEAVTSAGKRSKTKTEEQIVEALKPKLLEVLSLSTEPVSTVKLHSIADGHARLVRKALSALEKEGKIEWIPAERGAGHWKRIAQHRTKKE